MILSLTFPAFSKLPKPLNDNLYTEYQASQTSPLIKKPLQSSGYIAMKGQDLFIFRQIKPAPMKIRVIKREIFLTVKNQKPVRLPSGDQMNPLFVLFSDGINDSPDYRIRETREGDMEKYEIIPADKTSFTRITAYGSGDKMKTVVIELANRTTITYQFTNTQTGTQPDEKLFN
jgi:hypothetical protein